MIYLIIITILGVMTTAVALLKHFRTPAYRWMRTTLFLALGLFGIVPTAHGILLYGVSCCHFVYFGAVTHMRSLFLVEHIFGYYLFGLLGVDGCFICGWCLDLCMQVATGTVHEEIRTLTEYWFG